uniref:Reverse transcriptase domain-containing protein n=1 Tax=Scophthalmus maximus TaxID=52904 RepID=A0A8D3D9Y0_SCOMX
MGSKSDSFPVGVGLRQGCALSPILFVIFMDRISRRSRGGVGLQLGGLGISSLLFADNVVLMAPSVCDLQHSLDQFAAECGAVGMRISTSKSEAMVLSRKLVDFTLGYVLSEICKNLFKSNFLKLLDQEKQILSKWSLLSFCLIGRINSIKMTLLPKFLYLFQFGMALPNFQYYYWAANIRSLVYWVHFHLDDSAPDWVTMESSAISPLSLSPILPICFFLLTPH